MNDFHKKLMKEVCNNYIEKYGPGIVNSYEDFEKHWSKSRYMFSHTLEKVLSKELSYLEFDIVKGLWIDCKSVDIVAKDNNCSVQDVLCISRDILQDLSKPYIFKQLYLGFNEFEKLTDNIREELRICC